MPGIEWTVEEKAREWGFAKEKLIQEGGLLPDGHKLRRKDYPDILNHSFMVIGRKIIALSGKGIYLGAGINGHAKLAEEENGHLIALKVITNEKEEANSAQESKVAQDLGIAGQRLTRTSSSKKYPLKHYIAYQFLGIRLFEYLDKHKASLDMRYEMGINIALALNEIHTGKKSQSKKTYIHGDIHGKNIVIDEKGSPHFIDYGRAKRCDIAYEDSWRDDIVKMLHVFFTPFPDRIRWYTDWIFGDWMGEYQFVFYPPPEAPSKQTVYIYLKPEDVNESGFYLSVRYAVFDPFGTFQNKIIQLKDLGVLPLSFKDFKEKDCSIESIDIDIKKLLEKKVREISDNKGYTTRIKDRNEVLFDLLKKPTDFFHIRNTPTALDVAETLTLCRLGLEKYQSKFIGLSADDRLKTIHILNSVSKSILILYEVLNALSEPCGHSDLLIKKLIIFYCLALDEKVLKRTNEELNAELDELSLENACLIKTSLEKIIRLITDKTSASESLKSSSQCALVSVSGISKTKAYLNKAVVEGSYMSSMKSNHSFFQKSCFTPDRHLSAAEQDSNFAESVLDVIKDDSESKIEIAKAAQRLRAVVIAPILNKLETGKKLDAEEEQSLNFLISEHSSDDPQWEGAMQDYSTAEIKDNSELQKELLQRFSDTMNPERIKANTDVNHLSKVMKAITDCSFCYVEKLAQKKTGYSKARFEGICEWVMPTKAELDMRVRRTPEHLAMTDGLGMVIGTDIAPRGAIHTRAYRAGKAAFAAADVYQRARLVVDRYDAAVAAIRSEENPPASPEKIRQLAEAKTAVKALEEKMAFYKIPLKPADRKEDFIRRIPIPGIQHLASWGSNLAYGSSLPLIAGASATAARVLVALHDLGFFYDLLGIFQSKSAGYLATALCGTIVRNGHHSVLEVGEIYNRLIDYEAVRHVEAIAPGEATGLNEECMPYYHIGDSVSLVPEVLRERVLDEYTQVSSKCSV